ncbi:hypothetical protein ABZ419_11330 [Streptomyces cinnamoneus]|uniref:hypothetical protein n=1 Tax=Streptomyces cinnamoneus TaxID=53446 RepID=UPI0033E96AB3
METLRAVVAEITDEANARNVIAEATRELTGRVVVWPTQATTPRRFVLRRHRDVSGISGEGQVADGVLWPDGTASIRWRGEHPSIVFWDRGRTSVEFIHGHQGATEIELLDTEDGCPDTVRTPPDTTPTCTDTSSAGLRRKPSDTDLTDPDTLRREYADAIRAHSWASAPTRVDAITDSVMAVHDRALDALRTKLARQNLRVAELEAANHLLQQANRVRPYTDERRPPLPRRQRHAQ